MATVTQEKIDALEAGINQALAKVEQVIALQVYAEDLPLIGTQLKSAFDQGKDALEVVSQLKTAVFGALAAIDTVEERLDTAVAAAINAALASAGFIGNSASAVVNGSGDVVLTFATNKVASDTISLGGDLGLGALGIQTAGTATASFGYSFSLSVGADGSGFYVDTAATNEVDVTFNLSGANVTADAQLGPLNFNATDAGSVFSGAFAVNLKDGDNKLRLSELDNDILDATISGNAHVELDLQGDMGSAALPSIGATLVVDWGFSAGTVVNPGDGNAGFGSTPVVKLEDVSVDLGTFMTGFVKPVLEKLEPVLEPINKLLAVINSDIKVLKSFSGWETLFDKSGDGKVTLLDLVKIASPSTNIQPLADFIKLAQNVLDWAEYLSGANFGPDSYVIGDFTIDGDIRTPNFDLAAAQATFGGLAGDLGSFVDALSGEGWDDASSGGDSGKEILQTMITGGDFSLPILNDPTQIIRLLLGGNADLFRLDLPEVSFTASKQDMVSFSVFPGIDVEVGGSIGLALDLAFGFDTRGLLDTGSAIDGFYILDGAGPEVELSASISLGIALDVLVAKLYGGGDITGTVEFDLADDIGSVPGRIYIDEMAALLTSNPFQIFDTSGKITGGFTAYATVFWGEVWRHTSPRVTLGSFSFDNPSTGTGTTPEPSPQLGDKSGSELVVNIGGRAHLRSVAENPMVEQRIHEDIEIGQGSGGTTIFGFGRQQIFTGISRVVADGGTGSDAIVMGDDVQNVAADFSGGDGEDVLVGGKLADTLDGDGARDYIEGNDGADVVNGGGGDDILVGGLGGDIIDGGENADGSEDRDVVSYFRSAAAVVLDLSTGINSGGEAGGDTIINVEVIEASAHDDVVTAGGAANILAGLGGNDTLTGNAANNVLVGNSGHDTLDGGGGQDILIGGMGDDTYVVNDAGDDVQENRMQEIPVPADGGTDLVKASINYSLDHVDRQDIENLALLGGARIGTGNAGGNVLSGTAGLDTLNGLGGTDTLWGAAGADRLNGGAEADILHGEAGADTLDGGGGADDLRGGADDDTYWVDDAADKVTEGDAAGTDTVRASVDYALAAGVRVERLMTADDAGTTTRELTGNEFAQTLTGDQGDNTLQGRGGADRLIGGAGFDTASYKHALLGVTIDLALASQAGGEAQGDTYSEIERIEGTESLDRFAGTGEVDRFRGLGGNDTFVGGAGNDTFHGGSGNDTMFGDAGQDSMAGGAGDDVFHVDTLADAVDEVADGGAGRDTIIASLNYSLVGNEAVEDLSITGSAREATGNGQGNLITTTGFDDVIDGRGGADDMRGLGGNDTYHLDHMGDRVTELAGQGTDLVLLATAGLALASQGNPDPVVDYSLETWGAQVENLTLTDDVWRINVRANERDNVIIGNRRDNNLHGLGGNDSLIAGGGTDTLYGGEGNDTGVFDLSGPVGGNGWFDGDSGGADTLVMDWTGANHGIVFSANYYARYVDNVGTRYLEHFNVERFQLTGGTAGDDLRGAALDDMLYGGGGDDSLRGFGGKGTYDGGAGVDTVLDTTVASATGLNFSLVLAQTRNAQVVVNAGTAIETRWKDVEAARLTLGAGNDTLDARGVFASNTHVQHEFDAGAGNDHFAVDFRSIGNHSFKGGAGTDTLTIDWGLAVHGVGYSADYYAVYVDNVGTRYVYYYDAERFRLTGGSNNDDLRGKDLDDILIGNGGDDALRGLTGKDVFDGGEGVDTVLDMTIASAAGKDFVLNLAATQLAEVVVSAGTDIETKWRNIEAARLVTGSGNDVLDARLLFAGGTHVQHEFDAGAGNDTFAVDFRSIGNHRFAAGEGTDTLILDWSEALHGVGYSADYYFVYIDHVGTRYMSHSEVERFHLRGGSGGDDLRGAALDDFLSGGAGHDALRGFAGKATFHGGDGIDTVLDTTIASTGTAHFVLVLAETKGAEVTVNGGTEFETRWKDIEAARLVTGAGNDVLDARLLFADATHVQHELDAGAGNDTFGVDFRSIGNHVFKGGDGIDTLILDWSEANHGIGYSAGWYYVYVDSVGTRYMSHESVERFQLTGGSNDDDLRGSLRDDILKGLGGHDALRGIEGRDAFDGGAGVDTVLDTKIDSAVGLDFRLSLAATQGREVVLNSGTAIQTKWKDIESVRLTLGAGSDLLDARGLFTGNTHVQHEFDAGAGNDSFGVDFRSIGNHVFKGGDGNDTLILDWSEAQHGIGYATGWYSVYVDNVGTRYMSHDGVEHFQLTGGAGSDDLRGAELDDVLIGGAGHDALRGFAGKAAFDGGDGVDTVLDTTIASDMGKNFILRLADAATEEVVVNAGTDIETRWRGIESVRLTLGAGDDLIDARGVFGGTTHVQHEFYAGAGDDMFAVDFRSVGYHQFSAGDGVDTLILNWSEAHHGISYSAGWYSVYVDNVGTRHMSYSGVERFQITGGAGGDDLRGGDRSDLLAGGGGNDDLRGGGGSDTFLYSAGVDSIWDFQVGVDKLGGAAFADVTSFTELMELVDKANLSDTVINFATGMRLTLVGVSWEALKAADVLNTAPVISSNGGGSVATVGVVEGLMAVTTVAAADPQGHEIAFSIAGGTDAARFTINAATGQLAFKAAPDFELPSDSDANNVYNVVVRATDGFGLLDTQTINVSVGNDTSENPVIVSNGGLATARISVKENGTAVTVVQVKDDDAGTTKTFKLSGADVARFAIATDGTLAFKTAPNFEAPGDVDKDNIYDVTVTVTDNAGLTDSQALRVTVGNVNDAPAVANQLSGQSLAEDTAWSFQVPAGAFSDVDSASLTYSVTQTNGTALPSWLTFNAATRTLSGTPPQNYNGTLGLKVTVTDGTLSAAQSFNLVVTAVNDAPADLVLTGTSVREFAANGAVVGTLSAVDVDSAAFTYELLSNAGGRFALLGNRIVVADGLLLDREQLASHVVQVRVSDGAGGTWTENLTIGLSDISPEIIIGDARANTFVGGAGNDSLNGGTGNDRLEGRGGNDIYVVQAGDVVVELAAGGAADVIRSASTWTLGAELEQLELTGATAINGVGNALANRLTGNGATNVLSGLGGNDTILGGGGNDTLDGGVGTDRLEGGAGNDTYILAAAGDTIVELAGGGVDLVRSAVSHTLALEVENLELTGATAINGVGNALANRLTGNGATNVLSGLGGNDTILGGGGNDRLVGGASGDSLSGGTGNDAFVFASRAEAGDRIGDFGNLAGDNDSLILTATAFGSGLAAGVAVTTAQFQILTSTAAVTDIAAASGQVRFIWEADDERLWSDTNGNGAGGLALLADLQEGATLVRNDLIMV